MTSNRTKKNSSYGIISSLLLLLIIVPLTSMSAEAPKELALDHSINVLPDEIDGISMISKTWDNSSDANNHFWINLYSLMRKPPSVAGFYQQVMVFDHGKQRELSEQAGADCSISQTAVFRVRSDTGYRLGIVTADRIESADESIPVQAEPRAQKLRYYEVRINASGEPGKSSLWLNAIRESVTDKKMCAVKSVRKAMSGFVNN